MHRSLGQRTMGTEQLVLQVSKGSLEVSRIEKLKLSGESSFDLGGDG